MKTPLSSILYVLIGSVIGSFGAVLLKAASGKISRDWRVLIRNWYLVVGVVAYAVSSMFFVKGVSEGQLSVLYPMVSVGYICTLFWSKLFFGEELTKSKFAGLGLIIVGIFILQLGNR
ncbi:MAG TPA: EamA family transporter [Bryobacteraceae bacterium]|nr:EamA family transporter [Bryobacteraceae bacterium]